MKPIRTTVLGGVIFLIPIAFVALLLGKAFEIALLVAEPIDAVLPLEDVGGIALANIVAVILLLLVCFVAGLIAKLEFFSSRVKRLDGLMMEILPGYAIAKSVLSGMVKAEDVDKLMEPVLVTFDDHQMIAFQIERTETHAIVFLPGSPTAWSGNTVVVDLARVTQLDIPVHQASSILRVLGRGSPTVLPAKLPETQPLP